MNFIKLKLGFFLKNASLPTLKRGFHFMSRESGFSLKMLHFLKKRLKLAFWNNLLFPAFTM